MEYKSTEAAKREKRRRFLQSIAEENREILQKGGYEADGRGYAFRGSAEELARAECWPQDRLADVLEQERQRITDRKAEILFREADSFTFPCDAVLNFANGKTPGGGYLYGASSQEESLCRESTLYASLSSSAAAGMYRFNRRYDYPEGSDFFIFSPHVEIFRRSADEGHKLFGPPVLTSVITAPAADLRGEARLFPMSEIERVMVQRIRYILALASFRGCRSIALGAWGCGVFGHRPADVARYFRQVLTEEHFSSLFDRVLFAIYSPGDPSYMESFRSVLEK